jgi:hypothetical protein
MAHPKYNLPRYLYHVAQGAKVFNTQEDIENAIDNEGWEETPNNMQATEILKEKIIFHKAETKRLSAELSEIEFAAKRKEDAETDWVCDVPGCRRVFASQASLDKHKEQHTRSQKIAEAKAKATIGE